MNWKKVTSFRFNRTFAFAAALLVLAAGLLIGTVNETAFSQQQLKELDTQARILAQSVTAPLMFSDAAAARENAVALGENPNVDAAGVYGVSGELVASFTRDADIKLPTNPEAQGAGYRGDFLETIATASRDGQAYGAVYLRLKREPLMTRLGRYAPFALLAVMTALLLALAGAAQGALTHAYALSEQKAHELSSANSRLADEMEQRKQVQEALIQSRKMEAIGQLTGGVAHDFNNLLMVVSGGMRMLERSDTPERRRKTMEAMHQAVERGAGLTKQLLAFARRQPMQIETVALDGRVLAMRPLLEKSLRADILLDIDFPPALPAVATDPSQLELAVLNLCVNARDAMPKGGVLNISAKLNETSAHKRVDLTVRDTGGGIPDDVLRRIFEPYFTTKPVGQGTGLGLSQVYGFVQQSGGEIRIDSKVGEGTTATLSLPVSDELTPMAAAKSSVKADQNAERYRVLVVEDEDPVADTVCAMLEELGHQPRRTRSAQEALDALQSDKGFDLVFSDVVMPGGKSGIELARDLETVAPRLPVLLTTGYSGREEIEASRPVLRKPYQIQDLDKALAEIMARAVRAPTP